MVTFSDLTDEQRIALEAAMVHAINPLPDSKAILRISKTIELDPIQVQNHRLAFQQAQTTALGKVTALKDAYGLSSDSFKTEFRAWFDKRNPDLAR